MSCTSRRTLQCGDLLYPTCYGMNKEGIIPVYGPNIPVILEQMVSVNIAQIKEAISLPITQKQKHMAGRSSVDIYELLI